MNVVESFMHYIYMVFIIHHNMCIHIEISFYRFSTCQPLSVEFFQQYIHIEKEKVIHDIYLVKFV